MPAKPDRGASVRGRAQLGRPPRSPGSAGDQQPTKRQKIQTDRQTYKRIIKVKFNNIQINNSLTGRDIQAQKQTDEKQKPV